MDMIFWGMLLGYSLMFGILTAIVCNESWKKKYYIWAKGIASLGFMVVLVLSAYESGKMQQFWLMLPAFFVALLEIF